MLYNPVNLSLVVPSPEIAAPRLDFIHRSTETMAIVACAAWAEDGHDGAKRETFRDMVSEMIERVVSSNPVVHFMDATRLVLDTSLLYRRQEEMPQGLSGLSLLVADSGETMGVAQPHVNFTNYLGNTAILVPRQYKDWTGFENAHYNPTPEGVFKVTGISSHVDYEHCADRHELTFEKDSNWEIHIGDMGTLMAMSRGEQKDDASGTFASITAIQKHVVAV